MTKRHEKETRFENPKVNKNHGTITHNLILSTENIQCSINDKQFWRNKEHSPDWFLLFSH